MLQNFSTLPLPAINLHMYEFIPFLRSFHRRDERNVDVKRIFNVFHVIVFYFPFPHFHMNVT